MKLTEFLDYMIKSCNDRKQHWTADHYAELKEILVDMKWDAAHSHLMKMVKSLTKEMNESEYVDRQTAWTKRLSVEQILKFMNGGLLEFKP